MKGLRYANPGVPPAYRCGKCGSTGSKLWRPACDDSPLLCLWCAIRKTGDKSSIFTGDDGVHKTIHGSQSNQVYNWLAKPTDKYTGCYLPAVPDEDPNEGWWGYTSVPPEGWAWWRALPTFPKE